MIPAVLLLMSQADFHFSYPGERPWIGPSFYANPWTDWSLKNGRIELEGAGRGQELLVLDRVPGMGEWTLSFDYGGAPEGSTILAGFASLLGSGKDIWKSAAIKGAVPGSAVELAPASAGRAVIRGKGAEWRLDAGGEFMAGGRGALGSIFRIQAASRPGGRGPFWIDNMSFEGDWVDRSERRWGPILFSQHTRQGADLKLTAQLAPLGAADTGRVELKAPGGRSASQMDPDARTTQHRLATGPGSFILTTQALDENGDPMTQTLAGAIRPEPKSGLRLAGLTCFFQSEYPSAPIVEQVLEADPDMLYFAGDQLYEGNGGFGPVYAPEGKALLSYLQKWALFGWAFGEAMMTRPTITIPDDHDVFHGNIWGHGGRIAPGSGFGGARQDAGGYKLPARVVNAIERTQTSHLPDPIRREPLASGLGTYYTRLIYGGVDFAVLEDRKFKSSPTVMVTDGGIVNGFSTLPDWDPVRPDPVGAELLGDEQMSFLADWARQPGMHKAALSQTLFTALHSIEEGINNDQRIPQREILPWGQYAERDIPVADYDSNAWPRRERSRVTALLKQANALHIAGDQHLGSVIRYDGDGAAAFCVPSISNIWPRRWMPHAEFRLSGPASKPWLGRFREGFGNIVDVLAVANPHKKPGAPDDQLAKATGWGLVEFRPDGSKVLNCWPRGKAEQFPDWPVILP